LTLDAIRGVAAILVVLFHCNNRLFGDTNIAGYLAVDLFFALSGFVIDHAYHQRLLEGMTFRRFLEIRLVRLYPLFLLGIGFGLIKAFSQILFHDKNALGPLPLALTAFSNGLMLPVPLPLEFMFPLNIPAWSLFFELIINIIYGYAFFRWTARSLGIVIILSAILVAIGAFHYGWLNIGMDWNTFLYGVGRVGFSFTLGIVMSRLHHRIDKNPSILAIFPIAILLAIFLVPVPDHLRAWRDLLCVFVILPLILEAGIRLEMPKGMRFYAELLGDLSYPIYILHYPLLTIFYFLAQRNASVSTLNFTIGYVFTICVVAWFIERYYDRPVRSILSARLHIHRSAMPQVIGN